MKYSLLLTFSCSPSLRKKDFEKFFYNFALPLNKYLRSKKEIVLNLAFDISFFEKLTSFDFPETAKYIEDLKLGLLEETENELLLPIMYHSVLDGLSAEVIQRNILYSELGIGYYLGSTETFEGDATAVLKNVNSFYLRQPDNIHNILPVLNEMGFKKIIVDVDSLNNPEPLQSLNDPKSSIKIGKSIKLYQEGVGSLDTRRINVVNIFEYDYSSKQVFSQFLEVLEEVIARGDDYVTVSEFEGSKDLDDLVDRYSDISQVMQSTPDSGFANDYSELAKASVSMLQSGLEPLDISEVNPSLGLVNSKLPWFNEKLNEYFLFKTLSLDIKSSEDRREILEMSKEKSLK